ncbi:MAG: efflux RND transporter periplasmic adaptor subunit [Bacteroidota bacterium]|nr:efflux RND transporter periplasmic adaptor subunit [Bacteroidota bacterium]
MKKIIIIIVGIALLGLMAFKLYENKTVINEKNKINITKSFKVTVSTQKVMRKNMDKTLTLVGSVISNQETQILSQAAGEITALNFKLGDFKTKGSVIAQVDNRLKKLALETAQLNYAKLKDDYLKYKKLYEGNATSEAQYREIKFAYENAGIQVEQAKQQLEYCKVKAPFSGYITSKSIELGSYVNVANPVASIVDISKLKIALNVSESDAYALKLGKTAEVTTAQYPDVTYKGTITYISPKSDKTHDYPIEISIENIKKFPLKAGTFVNVNIELKNPTVPLVIPREALVGSLSEASVYVYENGVANQRKVTIGRDYNNYLEVLDGLKENELVITNGQINITDKSKVELVK